MDTLATGNDQLLSEHLVGQMAWNHRHYTRQVAAHVAASQLIASTASTMQVMVCARAGGVAMTNCGGVGCRCGGVGE